MLQSMRDKMSGWITWFIVIVIVLVFALFGLGYYFQGMMNQPNEVASVNGQKLYAQQVQLVYRNLRNHIGNKVLDSKAQAALHKQAMNTLIEQTLMQQNANALGLGVSQDQLDALIVHLPAFQVNGQFSQQRYNTILQNMGMDTDMLRAQLKASILENQLEGGVAQSGFALPAEIQHFAALLGQTRDVQYLLFPLSEYTHQVKVSAAAIEDQYHSHAQHYYTQPKVKIAYIELSLSRLMKAKHLTQAQAEGQYYKIGQQMANQTFENPNSLTFAAKQLGLKVHHTGWVTKAGTKAGITSHAAILKAAFSDEVLHQGNNSDVINLDKSHAVVVRVTQYEPAKLKPLAQVKQQIIAQLTAKQAQQLANKQAQNLLTQLQSGTAIDHVAHKVGHRVHTEKQVKRDSKDLSPGILQQVFALPAPVAGKASCGMQFDATKQAMVVFCITNVMMKANKVSKEQAASYQAVYSNMWAASLYAHYAKALKQQAKIKVVKTSH